MRLQSCIVGRRLAGTLRDATTGSASTARRLRTRPAVIDHPVRFNAETDSLDSCILGADAAAGAPGFGLCHPRGSARDGGQGGPEMHGDRIKVRLICKEKSLCPGQGYGEVHWDTQITRHDGAAVAAYNVLTMVSEKPVPDA